MVCWVRCPAPRSRPCGTPEREPCRCRRGGVRCVCTRAHVQVSCHLASFDGLPDPPFPPRWGILCTPHFPAFLVVRSTPLLRRWRLQRPAHLPPPRLLRLWGTRRGGAGEWRRGSGSREEGLLRASSIEGKRRGCCPTGVVAGRCCMVLGGVGRGWAVLRGGWREAVRVAAASDKAPCPAQGTTRSRSWRPWLGV